MYKSRPKSEYLWKLSKDCKRYYLCCPAILSEYWCALVWSRAMQYTPCNIPTVPNSCDKYILSSEHFNRLYSQTDWHDYQVQRSALIDIFYIPRSQNSYANILRPLKTFLSAIGLTEWVVTKEQFIGNGWCSAFEKLRLKPWKYKGNENDTCY